MNTLDEKRLYEEAYFLIKHVGMSYADVKITTRRDRLAFSSLFQKEANLRKEMLDSQKK